MENSIKDLKGILKTTIDTFNTEVETQMETHLENEKKYLEFTLPFSAENLSRITVNPGVYLIQVELESLLKAINSNKVNWKKDFELFWKDPLINSQFESMPDIHKDILLNTKNERWINLYVGKRINLKSRLKEHLHKSPHPKTGALKLDKRINSLKGVKFRLTTFSFSKGDKDIDQIICKVLEDKLRSLRNPILGIK